MNVRDAGRFDRSFEFREGKIIARRDYDCFYPW
jgi:hypothetical protein